ncbi:MAG: hypothetical protein WCC39_11065, partial [Telluria sp.]
QQDIIVIHDHHHSVLHQLLFTSSPQHCSQHEKTIGGPHNPATIIRLISAQATVNRTTSGRSPGRTR